MCMTILKLFTLIISLLSLVLAVKNERDLNRLEGKGRRKNKKN